MTNWEEIYIQFSQNDNEILKRERRDRHKGIISGRIISRISQTNICIIIIKSKNP